MIDRDIDWPLRWRSAYIPERLHGRTLDDWHPTSDSARRAKSAAWEFVSTVHERVIPPREDSSQEHRDLYGVGMSIIGSHGVGKTELACAILTTAHRTLDIHPSIGYIRADDFIRASIMAGRQPRTEQESIEHHYSAVLLRRIKKAALVAFDDLGKEHKTDSKYAAREINTYLRGRHEQGRPTVVTSNEPVARWSIYDDALPSFAAQAFPATLLIGRDLRAS